MSAKHRVDITIVDFVHGRLSSIYKFLVNYLLNILGLPLMLLGYLYQLLKEFLFCQILLRH